MNQRASAVFELRSDMDKYLALEFSSSQDRDQLIAHPFDGSSRTAFWKSIVVVEYARSRKENRPQSDFPFLMTGIPVFSVRAAEALSDILSANGELLPLVSDIGQYFAYNTTTVIDALDRTTSELETLGRVRRISRVIRYAFVPHAIPPASIFKLTEPRVYNYVTKEFVQRVSNCQLVGFTFERVWSSENAVPKRRFLP